MIIDFFADRNECLFAKNPYLHMNIWHSRFDLHATTQFLLEVKRNRRSIVENIVEFKCRKQPFRTRSSLLCEFNENCSVRQACIKIFR